MGAGTEWGKVGKVEVGLVRSGYNRKEASVL